jgi:hypothetical protein
MIDLTAGYCRNFGPKGNDLSGLQVGVFLKNHFTSKECACRGIWVMLRLEADTLLILSMIDQLANYVSIISGTTDTWNYLLLQSPELGIHAHYYYIFCKCQNDLSSTPCLFCLTLFDAVRTQDPNFFAVSNYFSVAKYV